MSNQTLKESEKISLFLQAMAMENSLLQTYRTLFLGIEAALFAAVFALIGFFQGKGVILIGIAGLVVGTMWIIVCVAKGIDVDKWRDLLLETTKNGDLKGKFSYMKSGFSLAGGRTARIWFNYASPLLVMGIWILVILLTTGSC